VPKEIASMPGPTRPDDKKPGANLYSDP